MGYPSWYGPQHIVDHLAAHDLIDIRAAMLKNEKKDKEMPLYMVNILPCKDFDRIYKIHKICYMLVTVEHFHFC